MSDELAVTFQVILDSGAIIAYLGGEDGGDIIRRLIEETERPICVHVLNLCEVFYHFSRQHDVLTARRMIEVLKNDGIVTRSDWDDLWQDAAQLKADWRRVSLADCFGLSLARRLDGEFYTTDRHELEVLKDANIAHINFIR